MQTRADPDDPKHAARTRTVGIVLVGTMGLWLGAQWLGGQLGWETRYVFLFDLAAIAGTGPGGRIVKADIEGAPAATSAAPIAASAAIPTATSGPVQVKTPAV